MKIAAVVILYHPTDSTLQNIESYSEVISKTYVFDNTEEGALIRDKLSALPGIEYHHNGKNEGLPKRLNEAAHLAIKDGFDWLLTMDQDSNFSKGLFTKYASCCDGFYGKEEVAMFGTTYEKSETTPVEICQFTAVENLITSGTLLNLSLFKKVGNFDEALFIDCVDHDYSIRSILQGYFVIRFSNVFLTHALGKEVYKSSIKTLFMVKKKKEIHSPVRCYYMFRNMLYLTKKFKTENIPQVKQLKKDVLSRIKKAFLYGRNSTAIVFYLNKAYKDYKKMRMGKLVE